MWPRTALSDLFHSNSLFSELLQLLSDPLMSPQDRKSRLIHNLRSSSRIKPTKLKLFLLTPSLQHSAHCSSSSLHMHDWHILLGFTYLLLLCTGDLDSMGPGGPLTEGGVRYTIHPVTGHLITTEVQPPAKGVSASGHAHKLQREDKFIIKVSFL